MPDTITLAIRAIVQEEVQRRLREELPRAIAAARKRDPETQRHVSTAWQGSTAWQVGSSSFEPTWTTKQVAEFLGLAVQTVYNRVSAEEPGFPKPRKQGRLNAFIPSEIAAYRSVALGLENKKPGAVTPGQSIKA